MPNPEVLLAVRQHLAQHHEEFREVAKNPAVLRLLGNVQGEQLTRVPKGFLPDHPAADLLRFRQYLLYTVLDPAIVTTPQLYREVMKRFRAMAPFLEFLNAPLVAARRRSRSLQFKQW